MVPTTEARRSAAHLLDKAQRDIHIEECESAVGRCEDAIELLESDAEGGD